MNYGMLSSYDLNIFLYREGNRLYMSRTYENTDNDFLFATLSWLVLSLRSPIVSPERAFLKLPTVSSNWYLEYPRIVERVKQIEADRVPGIVFP